MWTLGIRDMLLFVYQCVSKVLRLKVLYKTELNINAKLFKQHIENVELLDSITLNYL